MNKSIQVLPIVVGITLCTASAAVFFKWYRSRNAQRDETDGRLRLRPNRKTKDVTIEIPVHNDQVALVLGRSGANVRDMETRHNAKITFHERNDTHQVCKIVGQYENVMKVEKLVKDTLTQATLITEKTNIPRSACMKMNSRGGKTMQDICQQSSVSINIEPGVNGNDRESRCLSITGSRTGVQKAIRLIQDIVRQDQEERELENRREPRISPKTSASTSMENLPNRSCNTSIVVEA